MFYVHRLQVTDKKEMRKYVEAEIRADRLRAAELKRDRSL